MVRCCRGGVPSPPVYPGGHRDPPLRFHLIRQLSLTSRRLYCSWLFLAHFIERLYNLDAKQFQMNWQRCCHELAKAMNSRYTPWIIAFWCTEGAIHEPSGSIHEIYDFNSRRRQFIAVADRTASHHIRTKEFLNPVLPDIKIINEPPNRWLIYWLKLVDIIFLFILLICFCKVRAFIGL